MTARTPQKRIEIRTATGGRDAFDARLNDIVRRAVEKVAENAQKIIDAREPRTGKSVKDRASIGA